MDKFIKIGLVVTFFTVIGFLLEAASNTLSILDWVRLKWGKLEERKELKDLSKKENPDKDRQSIIDLVVSSDPRQIFVIPSQSGKTLGYDESRVIEALIQKIAQISPEVEIHTAPRGVDGDNPTQNPDIGRVVEYSFLSERVESNSTQIPEQVVSAKTTLSILLYPRENEKAAIPWQESFYGSGLDIQEARSNALNKFIAYFNSL